MRRIAQINILALAAIAIMYTVSLSNTFAVDVTVRALENSVTGGIGLNTGVDVVKGRLLVINANKQDTWSAGATVDRTSNANGLGNGFGIDRGEFTLPGTNFSFLYGSLIGSLDNGLTFFPVGTNMEMTVIHGGRLRLYFWDANNGDNSGSVRATVEVYTGP